MDLLTNILQDAGLRRRLLNQRSLMRGSAIRFPCEKSIGLHVVVRGPVYIHAPSLKAPLVLATNDVALMARGCEHLLSAEANIDALPVRSVLESDAGLTSGDGSTVISGAYQLWNSPLHPFFAELPPWFVLRAEDRPPLDPLSLTTGLIEAELSTGALGTDSIVNGLLDASFTYMLRQLANSIGETAHGWSRAMRDAQVQKAIVLMHQDYAYAWTLDALAERIGMSRTALAERFRAAMGDTPLNHLRTLRMQRAMKLLRETRLTLETVAQTVGYQDAFGFSKVFKRTVGVSPKAFRQRDQAEQTHPFRFVGDAG